MKEGKIFEFDPLIYPVRLWASVNPSFDDVSSRFYGLNSEMEKVECEKDKFTRTPFTIARTCTVSDKEQGWIGLLVCIWKPKQFDVKTICHESAHCADFICEQFGITMNNFDDGEAYAYLIGWVADCINRVKTGRIV